MKETTMSISIISTKGQITLPFGARKKLGLKPGDRVAVEVTDDTIVIRRAKNIFDFEGFLGKAMPPEEERRRMMEGVAEHVNQGRTSHR